MGQERWNHAACGYRSRYIFVSGSDCRWSAASVERYDSWYDKWEALPNLKTARSQHASCAMDEALYVFGGEDTDFNLLDSVERLDLRGAQQQQQLGWT